MSAAAVPVPRWGPDKCESCDNSLPPGLIFLGRKRHIDCEEARSVWRELVQKAANRARAHEQG